MNTNCASHKLSLKFRCAIGAIALRDLHFSASFVIVFFFILVSVLFFLFSQLYHYILLAAYLNIFDLRCIIWRCVSVTQYCIKFNSTYSKLTVEVLLARVIQSS